MKISTLFKTCILIILTLFALIFYSGHELNLINEMHSTALEEKEKLEEAISDRTAEELKEAQEKTNFYLSLSLILVGICGIFALFGFYVLGLKKLVLPISKISEIISESSKSNTITKIPFDERKDEVGSLSSAINQLIMNRENLEKELKHTNTNLERVVSCP